jgi:4-amino-4-deoxy-L-arabinose transferase-like glycosyltransferase
LNVTRQQQAPLQHRNAVEQRQCRLSRSTLVPLAVLLLGAVLRMANLGQVRHTYDQAYPSYDALRLLDGQQWLRLGQPSSVFLDNPPLMGYLQALPLLVWRSPWSVYIVMVALNTLGVGFVYLCGRRSLGRTVGLLAAYLFAINPWVVYFSRTAWVQALLPLLMPMVAWGLWPSQSGAPFSPRRVLIALLALTAMVQTYVQAWGAMVQVFPVMLLFRRHLPRRAVVLGGLVFVLAAALYASALAAQWPRVAARLTEFSSSARVHFSQEGLNHAVRLVTGRDFEHIHAQGDPIEYRPRRAWSLWADGLLRAALLAGLVRALLALRRPGRERGVAGVLLLWLALPIVLTSFSSNPVHIHYLLLTCPAGHLLAAWGAAPLFQHNRLRWPALAVALAIGAVFALNLGRASQAVASNPSLPQFDGWPLSISAQVGATIRELSQGQDPPLRLCADGHEAVLSSISGHLVTTQQDIHFPSMTLLPGQEPLLYVLVNAPAQRDLFGPKSESFPDKDLLLADGTTVSFVRVQPYSREEALALADTQVDAPSDSGLVLLGYSLDAPAQVAGPLVCTTYWRVERLLPGREEWYVGAFYHLLSADGKQVANVSGQGRWGYLWHTGDVYISRVELPAPVTGQAGPYHLVIGLFDTIHNVRYPLHLPNTSSDVVEIPLAGLP